MSRTKTADKISNLSFSAVELNSSTAGNIQLPQLSENYSVKRAAIASMFMLSGVLFASWASRIPEAQLQLGLSNQSLGFALLGSAIGALLVMPAAGWLTTIIGSTLLTRISAIGLALLLPVIGIAGSFWQLTMILFLFGAVGNSLNIAINTQASLLEQRIKRPIMASFHGLFSFGGMLGAVTGAVMAFSTVNLLTHFILISIIMIVLSLIAAPALLPHSDVGSGGPIDEVDKNSSKVSGKSYFLLFLLGLIGFCGMFGEGAVADWSAVYLKQELGTSEGLAAAGFAIYSLTMAAGRLSGDLLRAKLGNTRLLQGGALLAALSLFTALICNSLTLSLIAFAGVGFGFSTIVPIIYSTAGKTRNIPSGIALSIVSTIGYFGFLFGPPIIGFVAEHINLRTALGLIPLLSIFIVMISLLFRKKLILN